jgi:PAS domain S-box-containing protein
MYLLRKMPVWLTGIASGLVLLILVVSLIFYSRSEKKSALAAWNTEISGIAKITSDVISEWYTDEISDGGVYLNSQPLKTFLARYIQSNDSGSLMNYLSDVVKMHGYNEATIITHTGEIIGSYPTDGSDINSIVLKTVNDVFAENEIKSTDIYLCPLHKEARIDFVVPVYQDISGVKYALILRQLPQNSIYPILELWSQQHITSESVLLKMETDSMRILNKLRFLDQSPGTITIPLDNNDILGVKAAKGKQGVYSGLDYRGEKVIGYISAIPRTPWYLVVKVDSDEVYKDYEFRLWASVAGFVLIIFLIVALISLLFVNKSRQTFKKLFQSKEEFKTTVYSIGDGVIITDNLGRIRNMNPVAENLTGWKEEDALDKNIEEVFKIINYETRNKVANPVDNVIKEGVVVGLANHTLLISKNGKEFPIADSGAPVFDDDGELNGIVLVFRDQTEEYFYRRELEQSNNLYKLMFEANPQPMWIYDLETLAFLEVNNSAVEQYGYSREEFLKMTLRDIRPTEDVDALLNDVLKTDQELNNAGAWRHLKKDGTMIQVLIRSHKLYYQGKEARHVMVSDITDFMEAQAKISDAELYYRSIIENAPDGIVLVGPEGKMTYASPSARRIFGFEPFDETLPDPNAFTHPDDLDGVLAVINEVMADASKVLTHTYRFKTKFRGYKWVESTFSNLFHLPAVRAIVINFRDITDRVNAETEKFRMLNIIENSINEIYVLNADSFKYEYLNKCALNNLGFTGGEMTELLLWDIIPEFSEIELKDMLKPLVDGGSDKLVIETFHKRKDATIYPVEIWIQLISHSDYRAFFAVVNDITERKKVEETLKASEEKFRNLFKSHAAIKLIIDVDNLDIVDANDAAAEFYGYELKELTSMKISQINTADTIMLNNAISDVLHKRTKNFEFRHKLKDGTIKDVEVYSSRIQISDKTFIHSIVHDITERKEAQRKNNFLIQSVEQSPIGIIITDKMGNVEYTNPRYCEITGYSFSEMFGTIPGILLKKSEDGVKSILDIVINGSVWRGEVHDFKKNRESYWANVAISPVQDINGQITNFVIIKEDITQKKQLLHDLIDAKHKAEESDRLKSAFLANMSHEIRTPMNGILGFMSLLKEPDLTGDMRDEYIQIVNASGERLLSTINDIIDISKIESGQSPVNLSPVNLGEMLDRLHRFFKANAEALGLNLQLIKSFEPSGLVVNIDVYKTESVLSNLIKNALKFTTRGEVQVICTVENEWLNFKVKDTGKGISSDKLDAIFDRFVQADISFSRDHEGSGLGLSISKAYTELMGGEIRVISELGKGSEFSFSIPIANSGVTEASTVIEVEEQAPANISEDLIVLAAEDDDISYLFLVKIFSGLNVRLVRALNGSEAVELCNLMPDVSLVLMDVKMPVMDGYEATRLIKKLKPGLPVIALTAFAFAEDKEKALNAGCDDYLSKPVKQTELLAVMKRFLNFDGHSMQ